MCVIGTDFLASLISVLALVELQVTMGLLVCVHTLARGLTSIVQLTAWQYVLYSAACKFRMVTSC
jgi:hypothetical protein